MPIDLANIGSAPVTILYGGQIADFAGTSVSSAGDVNGDASTTSSSAPRTPTLAASSTVRATMPAMTNFPGGVPADWAAKTHQYDFV